MMQTPMPAASSLVTPEEREMAIVQRWVAGESQAAIARAVRLSSSRVHQMLGRGLRRLVPEAWGCDPYQLSPEHRRYLMELWVAADEGERQHWRLLRGRLPLRPGNIIELL